MGAIQRVAGTLPLAFDPDYSPARGFLGPRWVTFGRSRVRESRTLGSAGAKAEWLSYPTNPEGAANEWEVASRPVTFKKGHEVRARVQRPGDPGTTREKYWAAHERSRFDEGRRRRRVGPRPSLTTTMAPISRACAESSGG